jgi:DNA-binding CsgD family transcriptional regulator
MQLKFILAHKSYIVLKGLASIIGGLDFLPVIRYCSDESEFNEALRAEDPDIIISSPEFAAIAKKAEGAGIMLLDHCGPSADSCILSWEDSKEAILSKIKTAADRRAIGRDSAPNNNEELSLREKDIVRQVALGKTNIEIADELFISSHTVITHRKNIVKKLGIKTVSGITVYAILNNIIKMDEI